MPSSLNLPSRLLAAGLHLAISAGVAAVAAVLVFWLWFPGAYRLMAGGRDLFLLVASVDVVMGPVLTLAVFDRRKPRTELRRDLAVIGVLQMAALAYGLHTVHEARPVAMVFEVDRFRMVTANAVATSELPTAQPAYRSLPFTGPWLLGTRRPAAGDERNDALFAGVAGVDIGQRPKFWQPYDASRADAISRSKPLSDLIARRSASMPDLAERLQELGADSTTGRYLPTVARGSWTAVLDASGNVLGFVPVDGFV